MTRGAKGNKLARVTDDRREQVKLGVRVLLGLAMCTMGVLHFVRAADFVAVMPPFLPAPLWLVWISGIFEFLGGVGIQVPRTRALAGWGLVLLYVAVFPANIWMAMEPVPLAGSVPERWVVWARLPFQPVLMWLAWWCTRPRAATSAPAQAS